jgi:FKBP-type peptidyl-prolyl cis-trans isomerase
MREGGRRHLVVPPRMGYGSAGVPGHVPPDSVIHIEVCVCELVRESV